LAKIEVRTVIVEEQPEGGFVAFERKHSGAVGQGETEERAVIDLMEAIEALKGYKNVKEER
jgi:predicted RNase H-like HicB family nuclease